MCVCTVRGDRYSCAAICGLVSPWPTCSAIRSSVAVRLPQPVVGRRLRPGHPQPQVMLPQPRRHPAFDRAGAELTGHRERPLGPRATQVAITAGRRGHCGLLPGIQFGHHMAGPLVGQRGLGGAGRRRRWRWPRPAEPPRPAPAPGRWVLRRGRRRPGGAARRHRPAGRPGRRRARRAGPTADGLIAAGAPQTCSARTAAPSRFAARLGQQQGTEQGMWHTAPPWRRSAACQVSHTAVASSSSPRWIRICSRPPVTRLTQLVPVPSAAEAPSSNTVSASSHRPANWSIIPATLRW